MNQEVMNGFVVFSIVSALLFVCFSGLEGLVAGKTINSPCHLE